MNSSYRSCMRIRTCVGSGSSDPFSIVSNTRFLRSGPIDRGTHLARFRAAPLVVDGIMYRVGKGVHTTGSAAKVLAGILPEALQLALPDMGGLAARLEWPACDAKGVNAKFCRRTRRQTDAHPGR